MKRQLNYLTENPEIGEETELFHFQKELVRVCVGELEKNENTFFAIEGGFGSGKTHIATAIAAKLVEEKDFNAIQFNVWSTNPASIRRQFLMHLLEPVNKESLERTDKKETISDIRKKLSIKLGKQLPKENIFHFVLVGIILFITIISLTTPIINIFLNPNTPLTIFKFGLPNFYFATGIVFASIVSIYITKIFYFHTGGVLFAGSFSIFGLSTQAEREDIDEFNFKKLFNEIVDKNTFIILDDIDRITKENIGNALAFLELLKECSEKRRKGKDKLVFVCAPYSEKSIDFLLDSVAYKNTSNKKKNILPYNENLSEISYENYLHKIFQKAHKYQFNDSDIGVLLKNKFIACCKDKKEEINNIDVNIEEIKKIISLISRNKIYEKNNEEKNNIRQLKRNIDDYWSLIIICLDKKNIQEQFISLNREISSRYDYGPYDKGIKAIDDYCTMSINLLCLDYINCKISFSVIEDNIKYHKENHKQSKCNFQSTKIKNILDSIVKEIKNNSTKQ